MIDLDSIIGRCREIGEDITFAAARGWKGERPGRKVAGYFPVYTPEELIHAAGMLPVAIFGGSNKLDISYADARVQSFICSIVRTSLELGFTGAVSFADVMFFHDICDAGKNLGAVWARNFPQTVVDYVHFPQNMTSSGSVDYLEGELRRVQTLLERVAGRPISRDDLRRSIGIYNENRGLVRELYRIKRETPWLLSAAEVYSLVKAGTMMPKEEHNGVLRTALAEVSQRQARPRDKIRVVVEGAFCEQPPLEFVEVVEEVCYIVDDDFLLGSRWFAQDVPVDGDPLRGLAASYIERSVYSTVRHYGPRPRFQQLVEKCRRAKAQAAILTPPKFCEPALYDEVAFERALDQERFPHLLLEFEEKMMTFENVRTQVETFAESILFYS